MTLARDVAIPPRPLGRPPGSRDLGGQAVKVHLSDLAPHRAAMGARIRDRRLEHEIAVSELAVAACMTPSQIHRIERGDAWPNVRTLVKIAIAIGVAPYELLS